MKHTGKRFISFLALIFVLAGLAVGLPGKTRGDGTTAAPNLVPGNIQYLARVMDQFHDRFPVYDDVSSAGNHFHTLTKFPNQAALVTINGSYSQDKHSGATSIRCAFMPGGVNFGGFNFQNGVLPSGAVAPVPNFGTVLNAGINLTGATALTFWARGAAGGEVVDFFMGGVGWTGSAVNSPCTPGFPGPCPAPDSTPAVLTTITLSTQWTKYTIDLTGRNVSYVLGGFSWGVNGALNPAGAVFFLDDIQYELNTARRAQRLDEPRFLASYTMLPLQPDVNDGNLDDDIDLVLRNAAFVYDNALAVLAFLADGGADGLRRARLIGDALVYATEHDRGFNDGRLRSAYAAGDIALPPGWTPNNRVGTVPVAGYYQDLQMGFTELGESRQFDTGNQAWAMISFLALYRKTGDTRYLNAARLLGDFIRTFRNNAGLYQGFLGGLEYNAETAPPLVRGYASTEHNLDIYAAFSVMYGLTGETVWQTDALHARQFVEAMWDAGRGCYLTGTINPNERNMGDLTLPLDVQAWAALVLPDALTLHPLLLECAEVNHRTLSDGFTGYDFNNDRDGVWFEGTGHMSAAYAWVNQLALAEFLRGELNRAQATPPFGDGFGIAAASHDAATTGFNFKLFRRLHVGASAWQVFAQLSLNPYYQVTGAPGCQKSVLPLSQEFAAVGGNGIVSVAAGAGCAWQALSQASWITMLAGANGEGTGTVSYSVAGNPGGARVGALTVAGQTVTVTQSGATATSGLMFYPLPRPIRLLETRVGQPGCDAPGAQIPGGTSRTQTAAGRTCSSLAIPANARAITGNITTVLSGGGYLTLYPSDAAQPTVANSNYNPNEILNNVFTVGLGASDGAFKIFVTSNTDVVVDVTGYYAPPGAANSGGLYFHPLPRPVRLLETRAGFTGCYAPGAPLPGNADWTQQATGPCAGLTIPSAARAIVGNATTVNPLGSGSQYFTLFPADAARPLVASSNYLPGQIMNAPFTVGLSPGGAFKIYPTTQTDLVIDVSGYYSAEATDVNGTGLLFYPLAQPGRLLDTRPSFGGCYTPGAPLAANSTRTQPARGVCSIPSNASGVIGNATVVGPSVGGYLTFWPSDAAQPTVAASNFTAGQIFNRHFTVGLGGADGAFNIFTSAGTHLVIDLSGYFAP